MLPNYQLNGAPIKLVLILRLLLAVVPASFLTSCATTNIPGLDRILFPNSSAQVGPLVDNEEQDSQEVVEKTSDNAGTATPVDTVATIEKPSPIGAEVADTDSRTLETEANPSVKAQPEPVTEALSSKKTHAVPETVNRTKTDDSLPAATLNQDSIEKENVVPATLSNGAVSGQVILIGEDGQQLPAIGTLVTLKPLQPKTVIENLEPKRHIIDMEGKEYLPRFSSINAGDQVVFVNKDNIRHNVFSSSGGNAFDLGTYGAGLKRAVTLKEPGIVKIYCNIHADMATFVAVGDPGLSAEADRQGKYFIKDLVPGKYEISIWNIRGEAKRTIEIKAEDTAKVVDRIDTTKFSVESHKNKFGGNYSKNAALFEDEFY